MFKITNEELIQIAAVDAGLDPFAEYCTRGMWKSAGYAIRTGEKPVLVLELWCPRERKTSSGGSLSSAEKIPGLDSSVGGENSGASVGLFFQFKKCHLFTREQVVESQQVEAQKESDRHKREQKKAFRAAILPEGIAPSADYEGIPRWAKRKNGIPLDVAVAQVQAAGFMVETANELFEMLQAM
jgi:hypothetical protein